MKLPSERTPKSRVNPSTLIIFSQPKVGKTSAFSQLKDCLIFDLEGGSDFVEALKIDIIKEANENEEIPIILLKKYIKEIKKANKEKGDYVYKRIVVDTATALEEMVKPLASQLYKNTPMGKNWQGKDILTLPNGAGYLFLRNAFKMVINSLEEICDTLIISGHVKDKLVEKDGKEMNERGLALAGKMSSIICSQVDAVGYMYRDENEAIINFKPSESLLSGSRVEHIRNKEILISKMDEKGKLVTYWDKIFK